MFTLLIIKAQTNREMKEKIRIFVCNKCCNTAYTTDGSIPDACTSQYWVRTSGICGGHYSEIEGADFGWVVNQEVEKRIAERMPSEEEVLQYFNNHFDCYADAEHVEIAMTNTAVLKLIWWFRNRMEGKA